MRLEAAHRRCCFGCFSFRSDIKSERKQRLPLARPRERHRGARQDPRHGGHHRAKRHRCGRGYLAANGAFLSPLQLRRLRGLFRFSPLPPVSCLWLRCRPPPAAPPSCRPPPPCGRPALAPPPPPAALAASPWPPGRATASRRCKCTRARRASRRAGFARFWRVGARRPPAGVADACGAAPLTAALRRQCGRIVSARHSRWGSVFLPCCVFWRDGDGGGGQAPRGTASSAPPPPARRRVARGSGGAMPQCLWIRGEARDQRPPRLRRGARAQNKKYLDFYVFGRRRPLGENGGGHWRRQRPSPPPFLLPPRAAYRLYDPH